MSVPGTSPKRLAELRRRAEAKEDFGPSVVLSLLDAIAGLERELSALREERDTYADRLELEQRDHEVTKGYRQHAEQQLDAAKVEVGDLRERETHLLQGCRYAFQELTDKRLTLEQAAWFEAERVRLSAKENL